MKKIRKRVRIGHKRKRQFDLRKVNYLNKPLVKVVPTFSERSTYLPTYIVIKMNALRLSTFRFSDNFHQTGLILPLST